MKLYLILPESDNFMNREVTDDRMHSSWDCAAMSFEDNSVDAEIACPIDINQEFKDDYISDGEISCSSDTRGEGSNVTNTSFLQSLEVLWQEPDPPPEKALSLACNSEQCQQARLFRTLTLLQFKPMTIPFTAKAE